ncbi:MAG TPA: VOC family protein [Longimicrobium sp.]|nr:VOC family protein [Longimicrobium sp.]
MSDAAGASPAVHEVFMYLCVRGAADAIGFYTRVFGARETFRLQSRDGRVGHAEVRLGPVTMMLADEHPEAGIRSPLAYGGTGTTIHLHVDDADALARRAVQAGAVILRGPADQPHGERQCRIRDPFGHEWLLGHAIGQPLSNDEIQRRFQEQAGG